MGRLKISKRFSFGIFAAVLLGCLIGSQSIPSNRSYADAPQEGSVPVLNVKDYGAVGNGVHDDTSAIQQAVNEALTKKGTVYLPSGDYNVTSQINIGGAGFITIQGAGGTTMQSNINATLASGNVFEVTSSYLVKFKDVAINNYSSSGRIVSFTSGESHSIENVRMTNTPGNTSDMVYFIGAFTQILSSGFINNEPTAYALHVTSLPTQLNINSNIFDNGFGSTGKGILVDAAPGTRPEGLKISRNNFILTGVEQITLKTILHVDISNNMLDQSSGAAILLDPEGLALNGVFIDDNYISAAQNQQEGIGIHAPLKNEGVTNSVITNNMISYNGYGIVFNSNASNVNISNNVISDVHHAGIKIDQSRSTTIKGNMFSAAAASLSIADGPNGGPFIIKDNQLTGSNTITRTNKKKFFIGDNPGLDW
ncbi:right-handed parallel beta-helix repeat-containing protein [Paenibacillus spongiae]|uniref:Right-handed parallel beta-helix repeat-containing protein n=1 Tax=Paenibacillus spongiae TaxID=2909671 RepID=A0ABY5SCB5_9BACL|nr:right-handed parallel beta-helix repeat-containing protein [Paenibacillus spongiae]UVI31414.1 right-handed parallel beta-helix repeat-containing protein [Paenibacillus spongiae]